MLNRFSYQIRFHKSIWITLLIVGILFFSVALELQLSLSDASTTHPEAKRVLVIANRNSPVSLRVAEYYTHRRGIPTNHLLTLDLPDSSLLPVSESISYSTYKNQIEQPLRNFLKDNNLDSSIRYLVLTKGIPIRIQEVPHQLSGGQVLNQIQSVDSTLAALDYKINAIELSDEFSDSPFRGVNGEKIFGALIPNLYWRQDYPFEHQLTGGYLVTRLDGYTEAAVRNLIDRALTPRSSLRGTVLIDSSDQSKGSLSPLVDIFDPKLCTPQIVPNCQPQPRAKIEAEGKDTDNDFRLSAKLIQKEFPTLKVTLAPPQVFATAPTLIAYASWGSNDKFFNLESYHRLQFLPGAIADTVVSSSGRTFFPQGYGQSLIGDLISLPDGVTGIRGYTDEPELQGIGSPTVLFKSYLSGANLAAAYYQSIRFIGWRDLVLGDPLATAIVP